MAAGRVVCAWCQRSLGERADLPDGAISHSICPMCEARWLDEAGVTTTTDLVRRAVRTLEATLTATFTNFSGETR